MGEQRKKAPPAGTRKGGASLESIQRYWKRTDKLYLLLCLFSSAMAVAALSSWAAKQGNGFALDEVTAERDARALAQAVGCGVKLLATAHAERMEDLRRRPCYRGLAEGGIFDTVLLLSRDKTYHRERMEAWSTNGLEQSWSSAAAGASASR